MLRPFWYIIGYDILEVPDTQCVDFVNACASLGLSYAPVGRTDGASLFRTGIPTSVRLRSFFSCSGVCIRLYRRAGLPSLLLRLLARKGLLVGTCLCALIFFFCGGKVWDIRVEGNKRISEQSIESTLRECGVYVGCDKDALDIDACQNRFLILSDEISWISVNISGNVAEVEVREVAAAEESPDYVCSNLVAARNGTVLEFEEVRGNIAVKLGEDVSEGQLLVGGVWGDETSALRFTRSRGKVFALCKRDYDIAVPLAFDKKVYTGRKKTKKSLIFFDKEVKLFVNSGNLYTSCDIIEEVKYFDFFGLGKLPFGVRSVEYVEYTVECSARSESEAAEQANFLLWQSFFADAPEAQVVGKRIVGHLEDEVYMITAEISSCEDIALEQEVEINILE